MSRDTAGKRMGRIGALAAGLALATPLWLWADAPQPRIEWSATDAGGASLKVPVAGRPSLLLFFMADQPQSQDAMKQAIEQLKGRQDVQPVLVLSVQQAAAQARKMAEGGQWPWAVVADSDYSASGRMSVHVWPTTVLVGADGEQVAHLAGVSKSFARDPSAYLDYASKRIDRASLQQRLTATDAVVDSPEQIAARHLQVAQRLAEKGLLEQARAELAEGMKHEPRDASLNLAAARLLLTLGKPQEAAAILDGLDAAQVPAWQVGALRGQVLVAEGKWDEALSALQEAVKLNPQPAEVYYQLGLVHQHQGQWQQAAESFRLAYEAGQASRQAATRP